MSTDPKASAEMLFLAAREKGQAGDRAGAIAGYREALAVQPDHAKALSNLGLCLMEERKFDAALQLFERAEKIMPGHPVITYNLGSALHETGRLPEAARLLRETLRAQPGFPPALARLAAIQEAEGDIDGAMATLETAAPSQSAELDLELGRLLDQAKRREEALAVMARARKKGASVRIFSHSATMAQNSADWPLLVEMSAALDERLEARPQEPVGTVFGYLSRSDDRALFRRVVERRCRDLALPQAVARPAPTGNAKPRIGFLSQDYGEHPVAQVIAPIFRAWDRERADLYAYAISGDKGGELRNQIRAATIFRELHDHSDAQAAAQIREDEIDVLVDLGPHTQGARLGVAARRPSPVQVSYLGFPATTGASFFDHTIADETVAPPEHDGDFSERVLRLPRCYLTLEAQRSDTPAPPRASLGLPETGVVFASFNRPYKIEPVRFESWMRLLREVEGSVLWLPREHDLVTTALRREARARGVDPERLVFAGRTPTKAEHAARLKAIDIALDTRLYNGHVTSADMLASGAPVVCTLGGHMPSRITASQLRSVGAPELIASSEEDYVAIALRLARDPEERAALRRRIEAARDTAPLFDVPGYAADLQAALLSLIPASLA